MGVNHAPRHLKNGPDPFVHGAAEHNDVSRTLWIRAGDLGMGRAPYGGPRLDNALDMSALLNTKLPSGLVSVTSLVPYILCGTAIGGNIYRQVSIGFASAVELYTTHLTASAFGTMVATQNTIIADIDWAAYLASVSKADDIIGLQWRRDASNILDTHEANIWFLGWELTYLAEQ